MKEYLNLYHILYFHEVANQKSYTRASERLNISQPALSKCISGLEAYLGVKLINYSNRVFTLTQAGERFEVATRIFFQQYETMIDSVRTDSCAPTGMVKIGIPASITDAVFLDPAREFVINDNGITLNVTDADSSVILDNLAKGTFDLGIIMLSSALPPRVEIFPLMQDKCYVVLNKEHHLANESSISLSQLAGERFLMAGELSSLYIVFQNMCEHIGIRPNIICQGMNPKFFMEMISQNQGVTVLPLPFIEKYKTENVVWKPLVPSLDWNIALLTPSDRQISGAAAYVRDYIVNYFTKNDKKA